MKRNNQRKNDRSTTTVLRILAFVALFGVALATIVTVTHRKAWGGTPPQVKVEQTWVYAGQSKYNIAGDSSDVTAAMQRVFREGNKREIILDTEAVYYVTDTLQRLGEGTSIDGRGASIYIEDSGMVRGIWAPNGGVTIRNLTVYQIDPTHTKLTGDGSYGCAITVGEYPEPNPATPCDNVVLENVKVGTDKLHGYGLGVFGLVRNPDISQVTFIGGDSAYGVLAVEWAYNADSTATEHPTNVRASGIFGDSFPCAGANPIYCSAVDGLILENAIIGYSANNGIAVVPGEQGFSLADPLYHHRGDTVYNSGTDLRNCQIRTVAKSGFVTYGKPSSSPTKRVYSRTTFTNCSVDSSLAGTYHAGFLIDYTDGVELNNCFVKDNYIGIRLNDGARNTTIIGSTIISNKYAGIYSNGTTEAPDGTKIYGNTIAGNGDSVAGSGIIMPGANKSATVFDNDFGKASGETQVYGFDKSAVGGQVTLWGNRSYGFTGGAAYRVTDSVSCVGNRAPKDSTLYSGVGAPTRLGTYSIPFTGGTAGQVLKFAGSDSMYAAAEAGAGSGDAAQAKTPSGVVEMGSPFTLYPGSATHCSLSTSAALDTLYLHVYDFLPRSPGTGDSVTANVNFSGHDLSNVNAIHGKSMAGIPFTKIVYLDSILNIARSLIAPLADIDSLDLGTTSARVKSLDGPGMAIVAGVYGADTTNTIATKGRVNTTVGDSLDNYTPTADLKGVVLAWSVGDTAFFAFGNDTLKIRDSSGVFIFFSSTQSATGLDSAYFSDSAGGYFRWGTMKLTGALVDSVIHQKGRFAAGTGTVTDLILGDSLNSYPDTAATVDTVLGCLTDANIPNSITIDNAGDVDTSGTKIAAALNTRADKAGPTFTLKVTLDSVAGDSAQFTELDVTNARIATAFSINGKKLTGNQHFRLNISNPNAVYAKDHEVCIVPITEAALTITRVDVTLDADPTTEIEFSLKWADAFIGFANATVIDDTATVAGVTAVTGDFADATVAAGKCIYLLFDAEPAAAITQMCIDITYDLD